MTEPMAHRMKSPCVCSITNVTNCVSAATFPGKKICLAARPPSPRAAIGPPERGGGGANAKQTRSSTHLFVKRRTVFFQPLLTLPVNRLPTDVTQVTLFESEVQKHTCNYVINCHRCVTHHMFGQKKNPYVSFILSSVPM